MLRLSPKDNVAVATRDGQVGDMVDELTLRDAVRLGDKVAVREIAAGEKIVKYGAPIGSAMRPIAPGERVHTHNMKSDYIPTFTLDGQNPFLHE